MDNEAQLDDSFFEDGEPEKHQSDDSSTPDSSSGGGYRLGDIARVTDARKPVRGHRYSPERNQADRAAVIAYLKEHGPSRAAAINNVIKVRQQSSFNTFMDGMVSLGLVEKTGLLFSLPDGEDSVTSPEALPEPPTQAPAPTFEEAIKQAERASHTKYHGFFTGDGLRAKLRRYIRDHQDEGTTITRLAMRAGYSNTSGASRIILDMIDSGILRRYQDPSDMSFEWRYQYVPEELSGVKVSHVEPELPAMKVDEEWEEIIARDNVMVSPPPVTIGAPLPPEPAPQPSQTSDEYGLADAADLIEKYTKEFYWATGSRDIRELVIWMKERKLAGE